MPGKDEIGRADQEQARREQAAREQLAGGGNARRTKPAAVPALELVQSAVMRSNALSEDELLSALTLLPAARAEMEGVEAGLFFTARAAGLTWAQIAEAIGFKSPQACQQHYHRLLNRQGADA